MYLHTVIGQQLVIISMRELGLIGIVIVLCHGQIARDVALKYLLTDTDNDNLLSVPELQPWVLPPGGRHYYYWSSYLNVIYPHNFWRKYDLDADSQISLVELNEIVKVRIKRHSSVWPHGSTNILNQLKTQDVLILCDVNSSGELDEDELFTCVRAFTLYEYDQYPFKVKSKLYPNRTIGYSYEQFKALLPKSRGNAQAEHQLKVLFQSFEWPEQKVPEDQDLLIGPEEGKFLEPTVIYFYLDSDGNEVLSRQQFLRYFKDMGGEQAFQMADFTGDNVLDEAELIAYYLFASCIGSECPDEAQGPAPGSTGCQADDASQEDSKAICTLIEGLRKIFTEESQSGQVVHQKQTTLTYQQL